MPESRNSRIRWNADLCKNAMDGRLPGRPELDPRRRPSAPSVVRGSYVVVVGSLALHGFAVLKARANDCDVRLRSSASVVGAGMPESRNSGIRWNADLCKNAMDGRLPGRA